MGSGILETTQQQPVVGHVGVALSAEAGVVTEPAMTSVPMSDTVTATNFTSRVIQPPFGILRT